MPGQNVIEIFLRARDQASGAFQRVRREARGTAEQVERTGKANTSQLRESFTRLRREAEQLGVPLSRIPTEVNKANRAKLGALVSEARKVTAAAREGAEQFQTFAEGVRRNGEAAAKQLRNLAIGGAGFALAIRGASRFSGTIAEVSTLVDSSVTSNEELRRSVVRLSNQYGTASDEVGAGLYQAISAGARQGAESIGFLDVALRTSKGGVVQVDTAVKGLASVLNAFNKPFSEAEEVADALFATMRGGQTTVGELSNFLFQAAPLAATLGVEYRDLLGSVQALTLGGTPARVGFTQIRAAMQGLIRDTPELTELYKKLGVEGFDELLAREGGLVETFIAVAEATGGNAASITKLVGSIEGSLGILGVTGSNAEKALKAQQEVRDAAGDTNEAAQKVGQSLQATYGALGTSLGNLTNEFGKLIGEALVPAARAVTAGAVAVTEFLQANSAAVKPIALVAATLLTLRAATLSTRVAMALLIRLAPRLAPALGSAAAGALASANTLGILRASLVALRVAVLGAIGPVGWIALLVAGVIGVASAFRNRAVPAMEKFRDQIDEVQEKINAFDVAGIDAEIADITNGVKELDAEIQRYEDNRARREQAVADGLITLSGAQKISFDAEARENEKRVRLRNDALAALERLEARKKELTDVEAAGVPDTLDPQVTAETVGPTEEEQAAIEAAQDRLTAAVRSKAAERAKLLRDDALLVLDEQLTAAERAYAAIANREDASFAEREEALRRYNAQRARIIRERYAAEKRLIDEQLIALAVETDQAVDAAFGGNPLLQSDAERAEALSVVAAIKTEAEAAENALLASAVKLQAARDKQLDALRFERSAQERDLIGDELARVQERQAYRSVAIDRAVREGQASAEEAANRRAEATRTYNAELDGVIAKLQALADAGDRDAQRMIVQAERAREELEQEANATRDALAGAFQSGFSDFFVDISEGTKTATESFRDMANNIKQTIVRLAADLLAQKLVASLFAGPAGGTTGAASAVVAGSIAAPALQGRAQGGIVRGPGTPTSDSIPMRLSDGEYVVRTAAVRRYGVQFLEHLNRMQLPTVDLRSRLPVTMPTRGGYASGGFVDTQAVRERAGGNVTVNAPIRIVTSDIDGFNRDRRAVQATLQGGLRKAARRMG